MAGRRKNDEELQKLLTKLSSGNSRNVETDEEEDEQAVHQQKKKRNKRRGGGGSAAVQAEEDSNPPPPANDEDELEGAMAFGGKKKKKPQEPKEEPDVSPDLSVQEDDEAEKGQAQFGGRKKKRGGKKKIQVESEEEAEKVEPVPIEDDEDELEMAVQFAGKKKQQQQKKKNQKFQSLESEEEPEVKAEEDDEDEVSFAAQFMGKKKKKQMFQPEAEPEEEPEVTPEPAEEEDDNEVDFAAQFGKKKKKNKKKPAFREEEPEIKTEVEGLGFGGAEDDEEIDVASQFAGKKKKSSKKKAAASREPEPEPEPEMEPDAASDDGEVVAPKVEAPPPVAAAKPTNGKKKNKEKVVQADEDVDKLLMEIESAPTTTGGGGKNKKKGKGKAGAAAAAVPEAAPVDEATSNQDAGVQEVAEDNEPGGDEPGESAAAKKKRKKKEKEKAAKAASSASGAAQAAAAPAEPKGKPLSKAARMLQEKLAKQREMEEQQRREEEERRRKEEEEQARLEQLEREKEEAKKRRKEREKQKREEKKKSGMLLTKKEKEEAKRRALQREQILNQQQGLNLEPAQPKKPKYESKKKRKPDSGSAPSDAVSEKEAEEAEAEAEAGEGEAEEEQVEIEEQQQQQVEPEEPEEEEEEDDWDAKSWDAEDVVLPPLKKEEEEEEEAVEPVRPNALISPKPSFKAPADGPTRTLDEPKPAPKPSSKPVDKAKEVVTDEDSLRSPICCILGHVDTGKTKLLDCIRRTKVQEGEAGGITQQIGATYFPRENIREKTQELKAGAKLLVPGLLVIDTPGHESFTNLRSRGSGLCDIAVLVIDIMHGLEPQTIESIGLLKSRKTPYVIALNKVDRLYGWKTHPNSPIVQALKDQPKDTKQEFETRVTGVVTQLKEQGLNSELYWKNKDLLKQLKDSKDKKSDSKAGEDDFANIVPTSAISGEGIPDLLLLLVQLTQKTQNERLTFKNELECTVLEVKVIEGLGTTIDVVLVNGVLHEGDQIVVCGLQGPIVTNIRSLLTPHPMKELRVKGSYLHHKELKAAQGIKVTAQGLEHAIAGTQLYVVGPEDDVEEIKSTAMQDMNNVLSRIDKSGEGVCVQASTLGSLEALLEFLKSPAVCIPVSGISIGPVHKKDVMRASIMLEKKKEYAVILAFDVKVNPEAREIAEEQGVRIFTADIIYHLFDQFKAYMENIRSERRANAEGEAVFPCRLEIVKGCVFNYKDPIVVGVDVLEGTAKIGTPLCVRKNLVDLGRIASLEINHKVVDSAKKGERVAVKIVGNAEESQKVFKRHFDEEDELVSHISRRSIDVLKENFRDDVSKDDWRLVTELKKVFQIQ